jgi:hypothetical protein
MTVQQSVIRLQLNDKAYLKFQVATDGRCRVILSDGENKTMAYTNVSSILDLRDSIDNFQSACETFSNDEN